MIRFFGTILAALLGLAFGSFLNVCLSRWPEGESVVKPRSHCRSCGRTLAWWENIPVASWIVLLGRCRTCKTKISWRYPLVECSIAALWALTVWQVLPAMLAPNLSTFEAPLVFCYASGFDVAVGQIILYWLLVALAVLDAENLWLPNWITLPGIGFGLIFTTSHFTLGEWLPEVPPTPLPRVLGANLLGALIAATVAAALILLIRWTYWLIRRREGIGLGDAKLMAMLGAWLGLSGALLSFAIGIALGAIVALIALVVPATRRESDTWLAAKLPLGTFLCIGGIISALWGHTIIAAYMRWTGF